MREYFGLDKLGDHLGIKNSKKKKEFSYFIKIKTIQKQNNICPSCHKSFAQSQMPEFYHINNILSDDSEENCQALHPSCYDIIIKKVNNEEKVEIKKTYPELPKDDENKFYNLDYKDLI